MTDTKSSLRIFKKALAYKHPQIIFCGPCLPHYRKSFYAAIVICFHAKIIIQQPGSGRHPRKPGTSNDGTGKHSAFSHYAQPRFHPMCTGRRWSPHRTEAPVKEFTFAGFQRGEGACAIYKPTPASAARPFFRYPPPPGALNESPIILPSGARPAPLIAPPAAPALAYHWSPIHYQAGYHIAISSSLPMPPLPPLPPFRRCRIG